MQFGAATRTLDQLTARHTDHDAAGTLQQRGAGKQLELAPPFESALDHRHVHRVFEICLADDARVAVR